MDSHIFSFIGGIGRLSVAFLIIGLIIFLHEFGHFIFAKLAGCGVPRFTLGWAPKRFSKKLFKRKETEYYITPLLIVGGYVKLLGGEEGGTEIEDPQELADAQKFNLKKFSALSPFKKFTVFIGGVLVQFLACIIIFSAVVCWKGKPVNRVILMPQPGSAAEQSGIKSEDIVLKLDGEKVASVQQIIKKVSESNGQPMLFEIQRGEEKLEVAVQAEYNEKETRWMIGAGLAEVMLGFSKEEMKAWDYLLLGPALTFDFTGQMVQGVWMLVTGKISAKYVQGPLGILDLTQEVVKRGFFDLVLFFVLININLVIINSIPIPAVDGGHILILLIESLFRMKIKTKIKEGINIAGFSMIILLMLYATRNDLVNLVYKYVK
jgi:regulator of sigma E protease